MSKPPNMHGMYPDADPTAPGGMSQAQLKTELITKHWWDAKTVVGLKWPDLIDAVIIERDLRERGIYPAGVVPPEDTEDYDDMSDMDDDAICLVCATGVWCGDGGCSQWTSHPAPLFIGMPHTKDYIFDGHYGASPSGSERWIACTGSLELSRKFIETLTPNQQAEFAKSGMAARQGTTAHKVAEVESLLMLGKMEDSEVDAVLQHLAVEPADGEQFDDEMAEYVSEYLDLVRQFINEGREVLIEERVSAAVPLLTVDADGDPEVHEVIGSADLIVMPTPTDPVLIVGDLKYGSGIDVEVERNSQARTYALGALGRVVEEYGELPEWLTEVHYYIIQPRLGGIKEWKETIEDLLDWRDDTLSKATTEALAGARGGAALVPGDVQCQWCPARGTCPALAAKVMNNAAELFDVIIEAEHAGLEFPETSGLTDAEIGRLYDQVRRLDKIKDDLKAEIQRRLHRGTPVPGFQLVNYQPTRRWKPEAAEKLLRVKALVKEPTLISPTAAEKIFKEEYETKLAKYVDKPEKVPVVAPEGDRRSKWQGMAPEAMFEDLSGSDE